MGTERNYARFYALLKRLPGADKETLVWSFTDGRTTHLHEMTQKEYNAMCDYLEERTCWKAQVRKKRSLCLKLMQQAASTRRTGSASTIFAVTRRLRERNSPG
jgi:hypothetical protein